MKRPTASHQGIACNSGALAQAQGAAHACTGASLRQRCKNAISLAVKQPLLFIVPIIIAGGIIGVGTWGLLEGQKSLETSTRTIARSDGYTAIKTIQTGLYSAMMPVMQMAAQVHLTPDYSHLVAIWNDTATLFMEAAPHGSLGLLLMPQGRVTSMYPAAIEAQYVGMDTLVSLTPLALGIIAKGNMTVAGPLYDDSTMYFVLPIYIHGVEANETWGAPFDNYAECPAGLCYDNATKTKWWGFVALVLDESQFGAINNPIHHLLYGHLEDADVHGVHHGKPTYGLQLTKPVLGPNGFAPFPLIHDQPAVPPADAEVVTITVADDTWSLYIWVDHWKPRWVMPLLTIIIVAALLVAWLVFMIMYSWREYHALLHSLLPESAIQRIRATTDWTGPAKKPELLASHMQTPAQNMLSIIEMALNGQSPEIDKLLAVKEALDTNSDVYRPNADQLRRAAELIGADDEVKLALMRQLGTIGQVLLGTEEDELDEIGLTTQDAVDMEDLVLQQEGDDVLTTNQTSIVPFQQGDNDAAQNSRRLSKFSSRSKPQSSVEVQTTISTAIMTGSVQPLGVVVPISTAPAIHEYVFGAAPVLTSTWLQYVVGTLMQVKDDNKGFKVAENVMFAHPEATNTSASHNSSRGQHILSSNNNISEDWDDGGHGLSQSVTTKLASVLASANDWAFDAFALEEVTNGHPLSVLGYWLLYSTGLIRWYNLDQYKLMSFLQKIESGYADNPYHNRRHAADVLQSVHVIMHRGGLRHKYVDNLGQLALYLAAIVHDYEHRGRNNDFLVNAHDDLAVRYNDIAPMENHHLAAAFALLKKKEYDFLAGMTQSKRTKLRKMMIELVLSTDMKKHFAILSQYDGMIKAANPTPQHGSGARADDQSVKSDGGITENERMLSMQMLLKCADLGHLTSPLPVHLRWVQGLEAEFFLQGDEERRLNLTISPLCDRTKEGVTKSQIGFFDFVALPLYKHFTDKHQQAMPLLHALQANYAHWKSVAAIVSPVTSGSQVTIKPGKVPSRSQLSQTPLPSRNISTTSQPVGDDAA